MKISRTSALTVLVATAVSIASIGTAQASDPHHPSDAIAEGVAEQIATVAPSASITPTVDLGDALLAPIDNAVVSLPTNPSEPVEVTSTTSDAPDLLITLPELIGTDDARLAGDGTVVYTSDSDASIAVQPITEGGTRFLTILENRNSPSNFEYTFEGAVLELLDDGSITVSQDGEVTGGIDAPWAYDADGEAVPTRYVVEGGSTLIQFVDHTDGNYTYPIVADPAWYWWVGTTATCAAQIAPFVTPLAAAKAAQLMTKAQKIIDKSAKLKAAVNQLGGLKKALGHIKTYVVNKGKGLTAKQVTAIKAVYTLGLETLADALGIGACYSLVREIVKT